MVGIEFVKDRTTREPAAELVHDLVQRAFRQGLLLLGAGQEHAAPGATAGRG